MYVITAFLFIPDIEICKSICPKCGVTGTERRLDRSDDRIVKGIKHDMMMSRDKYGWSIHVSKVCFRVLSRYEIQVEKLMRRHFADSKWFLTSSNFYWLYQNLLCDMKKAKLCTYWNVIFNLVQSHFGQHFGQDASTFNPKLIYKSWMGSITHHKYRYYSIVHIRWPQMWRVAAARRTLRRPAIIASIHTCVDVVWLH